MTPRAAVLADELLAVGDRLGLGERGEPLRRLRFGRTEREQIRCHRRRVLVGEAETRHPRHRREVARVLQPVEDPAAVRLLGDVGEVRRDVLAAAESTLLRLRAGRAGGRRGGVGMRRRPVTFGTRGGRADRLDIPC